MELHFDSFEPHFLIRGGFAQTVIGSQFSGETALPERRVHKVRVGPQSLLVVLEIPAENPDAPMVLLAHGMGGCSESGYMKRIARKLWKRGVGVFMMNHRGSGPGMGLSDRLWNGGASDDLAKVIETMVQMYPRKIVNVVGFSLSGNILLKYLGEKRDRPLMVRRAFAVNPPIDLKMSSHILSRTRGGALFNRYYMKLIHRQDEALAECFPNAFLPSGKELTILDFDEAYTAPAAGFKNVDEYYTKCSSKRFLEHITVSTVLLCSADDPFIMPDIFKSVRMSSAIELHTPDSGGHMGYISKKPTPLGDHRWMDFVIVDWACNRKME
ncbi:hypothetical protein UR09_00825 [Candidatus Nitromaritima sp. SCGC AAA799-A02]|nr:hypothetical protein UR09_00825 [Candidatus Nitromaritima sp. SCGC AAA799-A02]